MTADTNLERVNEKRKISKKYKKYSNGNKSDGSVIDLITKYECDEYGDIFSLMRLIMVNSKRNIMIKMLAIDMIGVILRIDRGSNDDDDHNIYQYNAGNRSKVFINDYNDCFQNTEGLPSPTPRTIINSTFYKIKSEASVTPKPKS